MRSPPWLNVAKESAAMQSTDSLHNGSVQNEGGLQ